MSSLYRNYWSKADCPAIRRMSVAEHAYLKWIDLIELMRLRYELLDCCLPPAIPDVLQECLLWAVRVADETEHVAEVGILLYLQDTTATRLSTYGTMLYKVSMTDTEIPSSI